MALDHRLLTPDGTIDPDVWRLRHLTRAPVGRCPCGGPLTVAGDRPWETDLTVRWYTAACETCGAEVACPNGRVRRHAAAS